MQSRIYCTGEPKPRPPVRELLRVLPATDPPPSPLLSPAGGGAAAAAEPPGVNDSWRTPCVTASTPSLTPSLTAAAASAAALRHRAAAAALPCRCCALPPASSAAAAAAAAGAAWKLGAASALLLLLKAVAEGTEVAWNAIWIRSSCGAATARRVGGWHALKCRRHSKRAASPCSAGRHTPA